MTIEGEDAAKLNALVERLIELENSCKKQTKLIDELRHTVHFLQQSHDHTQYLLSRLILPHKDIRSSTVFTGKASRCTSFFSQLELCFRMDEGRFSSDREKIIYAMSHLNGMPLRYMEPYVDMLTLPTENQSALLKDYHVFRQSISEMFGEVNPELAIRSLKQKPLGAVVYVVEFRRLAWLLHWDDAMLISQFLANLQPEIKEVLERRDTSMSLDELMRESIAIDRCRNGNKIKKSTQTTGQHHCHSSFEEIKQRHISDRYFLQQ